MCKAMLKVKESETRIRGFKDYPVVVDVSNNDYLRKDDDDYINTQLELDEAYHVQVITEDDINAMEAEELERQRIESLVDKVFVEGKQKLSRESLIAIRKRMIKSCQE